MAVDSFARTLAAGMTQIAKDIQSDMTNMEEEFTIAKAQVGTPLTAANAAAMTDHNKIYVYVGDPAETGYTTGNWYFWNGSAWESGGVYNSTALQTDTTLSIAGMAADAKATGDDITDLKNAFDATENDLFKLIGNIQSAWEKGGMYVATGIEYADNSKIRTPFIKVNPGDTIYIENPNTTLQLSILEFASNTTTASGTNERLAITYAGSSVKSVTLGNSTNYIRLQLPTGDTLKGDDILLYTKNSVILNSVNADFMAYRTGTILPAPMAYYRFSEDGLSVVDFSAMPLNTYAYSTWSAFKTALVNAGFPLTWSDSDYVCMMRLAVARWDNDNSIIKLYNFNTTEYAEMIYFASTAGDKYRWILKADLSLVEELANKSVTVNGVLPNDTDANDLTTVGIFLINSTNTYYHLPVTVGVLANYKVTQNSGLQIIYGWNNEIVYKRTRSGSVWSEWFDIGGGSVTNNYNFPEYNNSYTIESVSPSITTDTNAYLAPSGDTSDRTAEIVTMLTNQGVCRLGKGDYYVSNLQMPTGTSIIGTGNSTRIILSGSSAGFAIKMASYCTVSDCLIMGGTSSITLSDILDPESTVPLRHGILWQGTYTEDETPGNQPINGMISNVRFLYFTGGAITCYDTGYGTFNSLEVSNVFCMNCNVGVNVSYWSEFHKFTNVRTASCYYGCINNGGNNVFTNCDFSTCKVGFLMDNSSDQSPNNGHGSCVACVFNHTDSNTGIGIKILNCDAGFIFDGCQIFYSQTYIEDSDGVVFANCNYGETNCDITISGGGAILFNGNMHKASPTKTITNNPNVHFANCYVKSTGAVVN